MEVRSARPLLRGPAEWFTGDVWMETVAHDSERQGAAVIAVHFAPGARTAWHSHRGGQHLYVVAGEGAVQSRGEPAAIIRPGDAVVVADGEWHWHGATPDHAMTHLSITNGDKEWGHHVTEIEYRQPVKQATRDPASGGEDAVDRRGAGHVAGEQLQQVVEAVEADDGP